MTERLRLERVEEPGDAVRYTVGADEFRAHRSADPQVPAAAVE